MFSRAKINLIFFKRIVASALKSALQKKYEKIYEKIIMNQK